MRDTQKSRLSPSNGPSYHPKFHFQQKTKDVRMCVLGRGVCVLGGCQKSTVNKGMAVVQI